MPIVLKYGSLNLREPSGPVQACNGIALPFMYGYSCVIRSDDGCFVQSKHVAAIGFAIIKVVCRRTTFLLLRVLQAQRGYHTYAP